MNKTIVSIFVSALLLGIALLSAETASSTINVVARVGSYTITSEQLSEKIVEITGDEANANLSYLKKRELALNELIKETLLYHYAKKSGVEVTVREVDNYFKQVYGDHERVTTDGVFDNRKYQRLKGRPEIKKLLSALTRDLIINKAETVIKNRFYHSEEDLINRYFLENTEIDLSYVLLPEEEIDIPFDIHPAEAFRYYQQNRSLYPPITTFDVEFFVVPELSREEADSKIEVSKDDVSRFLSNADANLLERILAELKPELVLDTLEIMDEFQSPEYKAEHKKEYLDALRTIIDELNWMSVFSYAAPIIRFEKKDSYSRQEAVTSTKRLKERLHINYPVFSVKLYDYPYDSMNPDIFKQDKLLSVVKRIAVGEYSHPLKTDFGYLVIKVNRMSNRNELLPYPLARQVWKDYVNNAKMTRWEDSLKELYQSSLDELSVSAIHITRIVIDKNVLRDMFIPDGELRRFFQEHDLSVNAKDMLFENLQEEIRAAYISHKIKEYRDWSKDNIFSIGRGLERAPEIEYQKGLKGSNELVLLEKFANRDRINELVKQHVGNNLSEDIEEIETDGEIVYYTINSLYPEFLPSFDVLKDVLYRQLTEETLIEEDAFKTYYDAHKSYFVAPDSLQLTGLFYPIEHENENVSNQEVLDYFNEKKEQLFTENQIAVQYIRVYDPEIIKRDLVSKICDWIDDGVEIDLLQQCFGKPLPFTADFDVQSIRKSKDGKKETVIAASHLPPTVAEQINRLSVMETSKPLYYDDSWYIFRKIKEIPVQQASYNEVKRRLTEELKRNKAERTAYEKAQEAFIDISSINALTAYPDTLYKFATDMLSCFDDFEPLGQLATYRTRLNDLWVRGKLNTIFTNEDGYGVVFVAAKGKGHQLEFEEALPIVKEHCLADRRKSNAQRFAQYLRGLVTAGEDVSNLFVFWGGWHQEKCLKFNDIVPGVQYGGLIIENAVDRSVGEISHIIRNKDDEYLFYRLDRKISASMDSYQKNKEAFKREIIQNEFEQFISDYGAEVKVER